MSGHGYGIIMDIVVGVVGAFLGGWLLKTLFNISGGGLVITFITALIGAVILLWVVRLVSGNRART
ncbi:MAG: GlsB/YeaQ/YmgE family stress response membrane protein [Candidatus Dormibacteraeota bacterium]|nr:GlsB/YeaQ/YmgE family stress response membrane protein [Candidatus Dormibacteraeota bacterium]